MGQSLDSLSSARDAFVTAADTAERLAVEATAFLGELAVDGVVTLQDQRVIDYLNDAAEHADRVLEALKGVFGAIATSPTPVPAGVGSAGEAMDVARAEGMGRGREALGRIEIRNLVLGAHLGRGPLGLVDVRGSDVRLADLTSPQYARARADLEACLAREGTVTVWDKPGAKRGPGAKYDLWVSDERAARNLIPPTPDPISTVERVSVVEAEEDSVVSTGGEEGIDDLGEAVAAEALERLTDEQVVTQIVWYMLGRPAISLGTLYEDAPGLSFLTFPEFMLAQERVVEFLKMYGVVAYWRQVGAGDRASFAVVTDDPEEVRRILWPSVERGLPATAEVIAPDGDTGATAARDIAVAVSSTIGNSEAGISEAGGVEVVERLTDEEVVNFVLLYMLGQPPMTLAALRQADPALRTLSFAQFQNAILGAIELLAMHGIEASWRVTGSSGPTGSFAIIVSDPDNARRKLWPEDVKAKATGGRAHATRGPETAEMPAGVIYEGKTFSYFWPDIAESAVRTGYVTPGYVASRIIGAIRLPYNGFQRVWEGLRAMESAGWLVSNGETFRPTSELQELVARGDNDDRDDMGSMIRRSGIQPVPVFTKHRR